MNKITKIKWLAISGLIFSFLLSSDVWAQRRINYQSLANQQRKQNVYFDHFTLPGSQDSTVRFVSTFQLAHSFLPFRKTNEFGEDEQFYSIVSLSMELFRAEERVNRSRWNRIRVEGLESVQRTFWKDTAYAENYQQTQSNNAFIGGYMQAELRPGLYNYLLQLNRDEQSEEETSSVRQAFISPYGKQPNGNVIFVSDVDSESAPSSLELLIFGNNVLYGKDFYAFVLLPEYEPQAAYSYQIHRVENLEQDTTIRDQVLERRLTENQFLTKVKPVLDDKKGSPSISITEQQQGFNYALFKVPNSELPNAVYQIRVFKEGQKRPVAQRVFRSLWLEMPVSLLNLDVATDMLRFIESRDTIRDLQSGSRAEREEKFRTYWKAKDPTPETEYNELMAEYYRRIDYAYEHFTTFNTAGYESDQGQIYIKYGPPQKVERKFPPGEAAVEIWTYGPSQQFVFRATSGFGDFRLVSG